MSDDLETQCDLLINVEHVRRWHCERSARRYHLYLQVLGFLSRANMAAFDRLLQKVLSYRSQLIKARGDFPDAFVLELMMPPTSVSWFRRGQASGDQLQSYDVWYRKKKSTQL